jgi:hemoglobin
MDVLETSAEGEQRTSADERAISACVRRFYAMATEDSVLGPIFVRAIKDWPQHFRHMDDFWSRILLETTRYRRDPFTPHHGLGLQDAHFDRWRDLFQAAAQETLNEPLRERAIAAAGQMSHCWRHHMIAR